MAGCNAQGRLIVGQRSFSVAQGQLYCACLHKAVEPARVLTQRACVCLPVPHPPLSQRPHLLAYLLNDLFDATVPTLTCSRQRVAAGNRRCNCPTTSQHSVPARPCLEGSSQAAMCLVGSSQTFPARRRMWMQAQRSLQKWHSLICGTTCQHLQPKPERSPCCTRRLCQYASAEFFTTAGCPSTLQQPAKLLSCRTASMVSRRDEWGFRCQSQPLRGAAYAVTGARLLLPGKSSLAY